MNTVEQQHVETVTAFIEDIANQGLLDRTDQFFAGQFTEAFADRRYAVDEILVQGEKLIARMIVTAVHSGHFAGNAPTRKAVKVTQFREFRIVDGKIAEHRGWFDTASLLPQIQNLRIGR